LVLSRDRLFQLFKYAVYVLLAANVYFFFAEEWAAAQLQFVDGVSFGNLIEAYAATIDTFAWVVLLLMFELETSVLDDEHFTPRVVWSLHLVRVACYSAIAWAFYGYIVNLATINAVTPLPGVTDLCSLVAQNWSYAIDIDEYVQLTAENCTALSSADSFLRFPGFAAVVDQQGLADIRGLGWVDVINSGVWLLVVVVLEMDVWLQEHNRLTGTIYRVSYGSKFVLYGTLLFAALYWGVKGDFVDFWDAFLWLVAFVFIELNVLQWREESLAADAAQ
jgi:hypothetical protein